MIRKLLRCSPKRLRIKIIFHFLGVCKYSWERVVTIRDFRMKLDIGTYMGRLLFAYRDLYERNELDYVAAHLKRGDICFDVGANQGIYSLLMGKVVGDSGHVFAFEPQLIQYKNLIQNLDLNNLENVTVVKAALGSCEGTATLYHDENDGGAALKRPGNPTGSFEQVFVTTLDAFCNSRNFERIDFIKVDVEGAELEFLKGAENCIRTCRPYILMEIGPEGLARFNAKPRDIFEFLARFGYKPFDLAPDISEISRAREIDTLTDVLFTTDVRCSATAPAARKHSAQSSASRPVVNLSGTSPASYTAAPADKNQDMNLPFDA